MNDKKNELIGMHEVERITVNTSQEYLKLVDQDVKKLVVEGELKN